MKSIHMTLAMSCVGYAIANMYDVIEAHKQASATCEHGCADWSSLGSVSDGLWAVGKTPANAGSNCAQPGKVVNTYTTGSWCYCKQVNTSIPHKSVSAPPTHPLDGKMFLFQDETSNRYVSFAYTDAPVNESGSTEWMRVDYADETEAMPIVLHAVANMPNTYTLFNAWSNSASYQKWISFTWGSTYMRSWYDDESQAMPIEFVVAGQGSGDGEFKLRNKWQGNYGYVGYGESPYWLTANTTDDAAMTVKLIPSSAPPPGLKWDYCVSAMLTPEQINVQIAAPDTVVISFVTFETSAPVGNPTVSISLAGDNNGAETITGVTHVHTTAAKDRVYYMHFVKVTNLKPRQAYTYSVKSGGAGAVTSDNFTFRSTYAEGTTNIGIYGDMGVYEWNNMANLAQECVEDKTIDLIVHMGDHAYNEGASDERRGDAYMSAWQQTLANCQWMPIVGNHEYYDGAELSRYLNQTWEGWGDIPGGPAPDSSALGMLLATGNHYSSGTTGSLPSGTSRFFSVDMGLVHLVAIDLNVYYGVDPCGDACRLAQLSWLKQDLAAANKNRDAVPWVVVMSHYPFYCTGCYAKQVPAQWYESSDAEKFGNVNRAHINTTQFDADATTSTLRASSDSSIADLIPIIHSMGVDMYIAGHWHYYESLWPSTNGKTGSGGVPLQKDFNNPNTTVHITTGNGGPPGADNFREDCPGPDCGSIQATRMQSTEFGYGKLIAHNSTHMEYLQILNSNSTVIDRFMLVQNNHGPFPEDLNFRHMK